MAGKGKYDAFGRLVEAATESAKRQSGKTYKRTGTNSVSQKPQPTSPKPAAPRPAPGEWYETLEYKGVSDADLKRIARGEAHMDGGKVVDGPPPKNAGNNGGQEQADIEAVFEEIAKEDAERLRKVNPNAKSTYDALETDAEKLEFLKNKRGDNGSYKAADGNLTVYELEEYNRLTKAAKEAELAKAGVNSARKESGGSLSETLDEKIRPVEKNYRMDDWRYARESDKIPPSKTGIKREMLKESSDSFKNSVKKEAKEVAREAAEKAARKSKNRSRKGLQKRNEKLIKKGNKSLDKKAELDDQDKLDFPGQRITERAEKQLQAESKGPITEALSNAPARDLDLAFETVLDFYKGTRLDGKVTRESLLASYSPSQIVEIANNLVRKKGVQAGFITAKDLNELVKTQGVEAALENVETGLRKGSLQSTPELEKAVNELRGEMDINSRKPVTSEQQKIKDENDAAKAARQAEADAKAAKQRALQEQIAKPSLPVRAFNNTAEALKRNYGNGNVKRALQTVGALGGGLGGLGWLAHSLMSESDDERDAREQAELNLYR